ncbi:MAG: FRG domain-containing protein [Rhizobium sp.]|nr:FRG domain-containing protein [Rhizobium sp.]
MSKDISVSSVAEAVALCKQLKSDRKFDLFRGQTRDWPKLVPSLLRVTDDALSVAESNLNEFLEWSEAVPQMAVYRAQSGATMAIAQHYGIPTRFLDLTRSPEIAATFSKSSPSTDTDGKTAVIYCFNSQDLSMLKGVEIIEIDVDNLWRLEAQDGLFLKVRDKNVATKIRDHAYRIHFPLAQILPEEHEAIYPVRKSALECVIDQWIYRKRVEDLFSDLTSSGNINFISATRRQTYDGAFRWRTPPELEAAWCNNDHRWIAPAVERVTLLADPTIVTVSPRPNSELKQLKYEVEQVIKQPLADSFATGRLISFALKLPANAAHFEWAVSTLCNRCWDGIRSLPYDQSEMLNCMSLLISLLIIRSQKAPSDFDWEEEYWGEHTLLETAPVGGHIEAGGVRLSDLMECIHEDPPSQLTAYMKNKMKSDPLFAMNFITDAWILFDFGKFKRIFCEQFIPSALDAYFSECISQEDFSLELLWSLNFNPLLLGYTTVVNYRWQSPIATDYECNNCVYIMPDMSRSDVLELFISCLPRVLSGGAPFQVKFHGYNDDPRPIWEIPRSIEQCRWIVEDAGISVLEVFPSAQSTDGGLHPSGLGAFELWLIANDQFKLMQQSDQAQLRVVFDQFYAQLPLANAKLEDTARELSDWSEQL